MKYFRFKGYCSNMNTVFESNHEMVVYPDNQVSDKFWVTYFRESGWQTIGYNGWCSMSTGLKDKNDIEIFQGDVVKDSVGDTGSIMFSEGGFCIMYHNEPAKQYLHVIKQYNQELLNIEVVSNLYRQRQLQKFGL